MRTSKNYLNMTDKTREKMIADAIKKSKNKERKMVIVAYIENGQLSFASWTKQLNIIEQKQICEAVLAKNVEDTELLT